MQRLQYSCIHPTRVEKSAESLYADRPPEEADKASGMVIAIARVTVLSHAVESACTCNAELFRTSPRYNPATSDAAYGYPMSCNLGTITLHICMHAYALQISDAHASHDHDDRGEGHPFDCQWWQYYTACQCSYQCKGPSGSPFQHGGSALLNACHTCLCG